MSRNFPDFLDAYLDYSKDDFCPDKFHFWTGISVIAGALERKVWIVRQNFNLYPNLYIFLLSHPGMGKSTVGNIGNDFLRTLDGDHGKVNMLAVQQSQAAFVQQMAKWKKFYVGTTEHTHASAFFYASEGSNALAEITGGGSIVASLTDFYDCPPNWKKTLVNDEIIVKNACCNILACATFSFLDQLVPKKEADGGFASRLLFVVQDEVVVRNPRWRPEARIDTGREKLAQDLQQIYSLSGPFQPSLDFIRNFEEWFPKQDAYVQGLKSERMQRFLARKHTNLLKLCMVCAASEGNNLTLEMRHWDRAMELMTEIESKLPKVVDNSLDKETHRGITYNILKTLQDVGGDMALEQGPLFKSLARKAIDLGRLTGSIEQLQKAGLIVVELNGKGTLRYRLAADPNDYL